MHINPMIKPIPGGKIPILLSLLDYIQQERGLSNTQNMQMQDKNQKASEIIRNHVGFSLGAALIPMPGADLLAVSAVQLSMLRQLAKLYQVGFMDVLGKNIISAVVGSSAARLGASLIKIIPGVGTIIGELSMPALSGASTYALGKVVANHFQHGGSLDDLDLATARKGYETEILEGKQVVEEVSRAGTATKSTTDETIDKIKKLAEMKDAGVITEEEFSSLKSRLLTQI
jgi:uncharacterized protein (DUF697 family)